MQQRLLQEASERRQQAADQAEELAQLLEGEARRLKEAADERQKQMAEQAADPRPSTPSRPSIPHPSPLAPRPHPSLLAFSLTQNPSPLTLFLALTVAPTPQPWPCVTGGGGRGGAGAAASARGGERSEDSNTCFNHMHAPRDRTSSRYRAAPSAAAAPPA
eukprot:951135-Prymnesium_polylepis.1